MTRPFTVDGILYDAPVEGWIATYVQPMYSFKSDHSNVCRCEQYGTWQDSSDSMTVKYERGDSEDN